MDKITILRCLNGKHAAKKIFMRNGKVKKTNYDHCKFFSVEEREVNDIHGLGEELLRLEKKTDALIIRGKPIEGINPKRTYRRVHDVPETGEKASFQPSPRHWVMLDMDELECPKNIDIKTQSMDALEHVVSLLPHEFQDVSCWWQWSSSQGFKENNLSIHLWYWLDRPLADDELKKWATTLNENAEMRLVDPALFNPVQIHYTSSPIFIDVDDPLECRSGLLTREKKEVSLLIPKNKKTNKTSSLPTTSSVDCDGDQIKSVIEIYDNAEILLEKCLFVQHCRDTARTLEEPLWHSLASNLAPLNGGEEAFHEISEPYPGYKKSETTKKIIDARKRNTPHKCKTIAGRGFKCPNMDTKGECSINGGRTPITLAQPKMYGNLEVFKTSPPIWQLHFLGRPIEFEKTSDLMSYGKVRQRILEQIHELVPMIKSKDWEIILQSLLANVREIEAPPDASEDGYIWEQSQTFFHDRGIAKSEEDILLDLPWSNDELGVVVIRLAALTMFLTQRTKNIYSSRQVAKVLKKYGGTSHTMRILGRQVRVWHLPMEEVNPSKQTEDFSIISFDWGGASM